MAAHSLLSASAADRWANCPGSVALSQGIPDSGSAAATEGTGLHELLAQCFEAGTDAWEVPSIKFKADGKEHEIELNEEQHGAVQACLDYVRSFEGSKFYEMSVTYGRTIGQPDEEAFGTADIIVLDGTHLHVMDAKFGRRFVDCVDNKQMLLYGIGVVQALETLGDEIETISLHILQPRVGGKVAKEPWTISRAELDNRAAGFTAHAGEVQTALKTFTSGKQPGVLWAENFLRPSETACNWCRAAAICPALAKVAEDATADAASLEDFEAVSPLDSYKPEAMAVALSRIPLLETYIKAVQEAAFSRLERGVVVPGYKLIRGREGNRKWGDEKAVIAWAKSQGATDAAIMTEPKLKSPAQLAPVMKTLLDCTKDESVEAVDQHVIRNPAKPSLVKAEVPGEPWTGATDAEEFGLV